MRFAAALGLFVGFLSLQSCQTTARNASSGSGLATVTIGGLPTGSKKQAFFGEGNSLLIQKLQLVIRPTDPNCPNGTVIDEILPYEIGKIDKSVVSTCSYEIYFAIGAEGPVEKNEAAAANRPLGIPEIAAKTKAVYMSFVPTQVRSDELMATKDPVKLDVSIELTKFGEAEKFPVKPVAPKDDPADDMVGGWFEPLFKNASFQELGSGERIIAVSDAIEKTNRNIAENRLKPATMTSLIMEVAARIDFASLKGNYYFQDGQWGDVFDSRDKMDRPYCYVSPNRPSTVTVPGEKSIVWTSTSSGDRLQISVNGGIGLQRIDCSLKMNSEYVTYGQFVSALKGMFRIKRATYPSQ